VPEPDERTTAEVGDQERHGARAEGVRQARRKHVGGGDRGGVLDRREQWSDVQPRRRVIRSARQSH
jgi:hypothetical protein